MKYHLSSIMIAAWRLYRSGTASFSLALRILHGQTKKPATPLRRPQESQRNPTPGQAGRSWAMKSATRARPSTRPPSQTPPQRAAPARLPTLGAPRCSPSAHKKSPLHQPAKTRCKEPNTHQPMGGTYIVGQPPKNVKQNLEEKKMQLNYLLTIYLSVPKSFPKSKRSFSPTAVSRSASSGEKAFS